MINSTIIICNYFTLLVSCLSFTLPHQMELYCNILLAIQLKTKALPSFLLFLIINQTILVWIHCSFSGWVQQKISISAEKVTNKYLNTTRIQTLARMSKHANQLILKPKSLCLSSTWENAQYNFLRQKMNQNS